MRVVIQRVSRASCMVDGNITGKIGKGFMCLVGFKDTDTIDDIELCVRKIIGLRVFEDEMGKMNKSLNDIGGEILSISQFTLYADCKKGNRPSFTQAMEFHKADEFYNKFCELLKASNIKVERGIFGADMKLDLINDGPVTIILDSEDLKRRD